MTDTERTQPEGFHAQALSASLTVKDLQASVAWYRDVVGFAVDRRYERDGIPRAVALSAGAVQILLGQDDGAKRIKARGGTLESEPADTRWGVRMFRLQDPDGFKLVISATK